jgi:hypothetical protein
VRQVRKTIERARVNTVLTSVFDRTGASGRKGKTGAAGPPWQTCAEAGLAYHGPKLTHR